MKKILIINSGMYPVPAVKGGAVSQLIQLLLDSNEKFANFELYVFSRFDDKAKLSSKKYIHTHFIFVDLNSFKAKIWNQWVKIYNRLFFKSNGYLIEDFFAYSAVKFIEEHKEIGINAVLVEGVSQYAGYLKHKTGLPIIQRIHNVPRNNKDMFTKINAQSTDMYLGISKYICNVLKSYEGRYCKRIELLYNSINFSIFQQDLNVEEKEKLQQKLKIQENDFVILYTGRLQEYKGIKELLLAFEKFSSDKNNVKLLIIGSFWFSSKEISAYEKSLQKIIRRNENKIIQTGFIPNDKLFQYYKIADICSFPSIWQEPFALTCLEALVCGKPVVITKSGGMQEVADETCSFMVNIDNNIISNLAIAFEKLYSDQSLRIEMGKKAIKRAELFNPTLQYHSFSKLINIITEQ